MPTKLAERRAQAKADIAAREALVATLRDKLAAVRKERKNLKASQARADKRYLAEIEMRLKATEEAKAKASRTGKKSWISDRQSTGGPERPLPFRLFDAEFQTKMHDIMRDIMAAEEGVRKAKAAREAMVV